MLHIKSVPDNCELCPGVFNKMSWVKVMQYRFTESDDGCRAFAIKTTHGNHTRISKFIICM